MPLIHALTLLFVGLKLTGYIDWSWFFVILPSLIPLIILAVVGLLGALAIASAANKFKR